MAGRAGLGLAQGFMQGYGFMDNIDKRERRMGLAEAAGQRAEQSHRWQGEKMDQQREEWQRADDQRLVQSFAQGLESGQLDPNIASEYEKRFDVNLSNYLDPEFGKSLDVLGKTAGGEGYTLRSPEFKSAFERVFQTEINKGVGEEYEGGDGAHRLEQKRLRGVYPGPDGKSLMVDLDVLDSGPGGQKWRNAPVTTGRSAKDDEVRAIPLEDALKKLKGHQLMYSAVQNDPKLQALVKQHAAKTGTNLAERDKGINVNDRLVNPYTGEVMADLSEAEDLSPQQEVYAERLQGEIDHLWRMERDLQTGKSDGMSIFLGGMEETVTPDNKDALLSDIRTRIRSNEQELNKMLGVPAPQKGYDALIQEAENIPPEQREQELADLKSDPNVPYMTVRRIEEMWGMGGSAAQPGQQPQQQPVAQDQPGLQQPQAQQEPEVKPGLRSVTAGQPASPSSERPPQNQSPAGLNLGAQNEAQSLQDQIVQRSRQQGQENYQASARQARQEVRSALDSDRFSQMNKNDRQAFLLRYGQHFKAMPEPDIDRLKQVFGESVINQYLQ